MQRLFHAATGSLPLPTIAFPNVGNVNERTIAMREPLPFPPTNNQRLAMRQRPHRSPVGYQRWSDLLFLHWTLPADDLQRMLPRGLFVDAYAGQAYIGIVPFRMERIRPAWLPPMPGLSWFLELNVRTYVHDESGRPGVWFFSLDCNQSLAVTLAQRFFHLPYFHAHMQASKHGAQRHYACQREGTAERSCFEWQTRSEAFAPACLGTLEFFLVERYLLFSTDDRGHLFTGRVHHQPYRIRAAALTRWSTLPAAQAGFPLALEPISVLEAQHVDVSVFGLESASGEPC